MIFEHSIIVVPVSMMYTPGTTSLHPISSNRSILNSVLETVQHNYMAFSLTLKVPMQYKVKLKAAKLTKNDIFYIIFAHKNHLFVLK